VRNNPYNWEGAAVHAWDITYPAILNNCEACHVPGSYDFSNSANANAVPNLLWSTSAAGAITVTTNTGPFSAAYVPTVPSGSLTASTALANAIPNVAFPSNIPATWNATTPVTSAVNSINLGTTQQYTPAGMVATAQTPLAPFLLADTVFKQAYTVTSFPTFVYTLTNSATTSTITGAAIFGNNFTVNTSTSATTALNGPATFAVLTAGGSKPVIAAGATYEADAHTLVNSPITAACYACHDSTSARAHMVNNGGWLNTMRSNVVTNTNGVNVVPIVQSEQCLVCHGTGRTADIKTVHMNF
jgi:OmcA/MtrC family decaheme c-type cytochrome